MTQSTTASYRDIRGWFTPIDHRVFTGLLAAQESTPAGDLVEIGAFLGKSAVVIGEHVRPGERFVVIDLFGDLTLLGQGGEDEANKAENKKSYPHLTRQRFEENYLAIHDELPIVVQAPSSAVLDHVAAASVRFVHVDASHLYAPVAQDCRSVRTMLRPGGVAAFDDWRNAKCPGVAAAIWESVATDGLVPVAVTRNKLYAAHEGADEVLASVRRLVQADPDWWLVQEHLFMGHTVLGLDSVAAAQRRRSATSARRSPATTGARRTPRRSRLRAVASSLRSAMRSR
jgi:hypothetical protein